MHRVAVSLALIGSTFIAGCASSTADTKPVGATPHVEGAKLTLDDLFDVDKRVDFSGPTVSVTSFDAKTWLVTRRAPGKKPAEYSLIDAESGTSRPYVDMAKVKKAIASIPGVDAKDAERLAQPDLERMTKTHDALLLNVESVESKKDPLVTTQDLWVVRLDSEAPVRITNTPDVEEEEAAFSPDGKHVAFVAKNDIYVADVDKGTTVQLTHDGNDLVLNGKLDWLYQEEVYGRGTFRSYWWSPDSRSIAFLRLDETGVPVYTLVDDATRDVKVEHEFYPRAGEPNPGVKLGVLSIDGTNAHFVDLASYAKDEPLVVDVSWSPDGRLVYEIQDREQKFLDLHMCRADLSGDEKILRETTKAWVDRTESPTWLKDGTFLWFSERTGWKHLYHYKGSQCLNAVTSGEWEARDLHGVDETHGLVYFNGTERSPIGSDVYVVGLDGKGLKRLSDRPGTHSPHFNDDFTRYIDVWSDNDTPTQVRLHKSDGTETRVLDANVVLALERYALSKPELMTVKTHDGFDMDAMLVKPVDFDPARKYPVMIFGYWGPHAPTVKNSWGSSSGMLSQLLAQRGIAVWSCDNRSASGKGATSAWTSYEHMGVGELADIEEGVAWLKKQPWVDADRIGITGWSFGGFMTTYALTHSKSFALGVAGGSVTDWRNYDSIYTDRLMLTPEHNKKGYDATSVVSAAKDLHGELVLVHGEIDDNVHPGNTLQLTYALQKAGKQFQLMLYPRSRHGVGDPQLSKHWHALQLAAIERVLLGVNP